MTRNAKDELKGAGRTAFRTAIAVALARSALTQRDLARRLEIADTTLSGYLCGAHRSPPDLAHRIERALGLRPGELDTPLDG